ncbi:MAG: 2-amino-4-hydroxy-6-hydroxymethyldihydropteridine diphosphokinase [Actinomycetota bacterium]|nr:2-amino-4-hydroxy-6-hydroxymethyldihydropteridine diphosphokinase [Actinomycetota bacterium]
MKYFVALGSNQGDPLANLVAALRRLPGLAGTSSIYLTSPVEMEPDAAPVLNAVAELVFQEGPHELWSRLSSIEDSMGRLRPYRNAPRTIDLDIVAGCGVQLDDEVLTVPHPRARERLFVLVPLAELDPAVATEVAGFDFDAARVGRDEYRARFGDQAVEVFMSAQELAERLTAGGSGEGSSLAQSE